MIKILAYHSISDFKNFESQIRYLKDNYNVISIYDLQNYLFHGTLLPSKPLLITFDDGDPSFYINAFPILKAENVPAIVFIITSLIDTKKPFWWDELEYYLGSKNGYSKVWEVKKWTNSERVSFLKKITSDPNKKSLEYYQLTKDQLKEMQNSGICIANHSHTHPMFDKCTKVELEEEMTLSINFLREAGFATKFFAYPNGNFSKKSEEMLKKAGIHIAFLFDHKINKGSINPLRLSRLIVNDNTPMWKFKLILSGLHSKILPFTRLAGRFIGKLKK